jgi:hypothetical protein
MIQFMNHPLISYDLAPHPFSVAAHAQRVGDLLFLTFSLTDAADEVIWPAHLPLTRQDYLWESTCFEAFIGILDQPAYFELNLSPSCAWNLYRFDDYRTPNTMPPPHAPAAALVSFKVTGQTLQATLNLSTLNLAEQVLHLGLTAVIKTQTALHYLALHHAGTQADFHDARSWTITLLPDARFPESIVDK